MRARLLAWLKEAGHEVVDFGTETEESVDYPDFAEKVGKSVASGESELGILACGSGIGMSIAANKIAGIRAALCLDLYSAEMSRRHNDANVCCLRVREQDGQDNVAIVERFLGSNFDGDRHERRVSKINQLDG